MRDSNYIRFRFTFNDRKAICHIPLNALNASEVAIKAYIKRLYDTAKSIGMNMTIETCEHMLTWSVPGNAPSGAYKTVGSFRNWKVEVRYIK